MQYECKGMANGTLDRLVIPWYTRAVPKTPSPAHELLPEPGLANFALAAYVPARYVPVRSRSVWCSTDYRQNQSPFAAVRQGEVASLRSCRWKWSIDQAQSLEVPPL